MTAVVDRAQETDQIITRLVARSYLALGKIPTDQAITQMAFDDCAWLKAVPAQQAYYRAISTLFSRNEERLDKEVMVAMNQLNEAVKHNSKCVTYVELKKNNPNITVDDYNIAASALKNIYKVSEGYTPNILLESASANTNKLDYRLDDTWLASQPTISQQGILLQALRERKGISRSELATEIRVTRESVRLWELAEYRIDGFKLKAISNALSLDEKWKNKLDALVLPALDLAWLALPENADNRGGMLLEAARIRDGLTQVELAEKLHVSEHTVSSWETGKYNIEETKLPGKLSKLKTHLPYLSDAELKVITQSILPALDEKWLEEQPAKNHGRLLLAAFRKRSGLTQDTLAQLIDETVIQYKSWESGNASINANKLGLLVKALNLSEQEAEKLIIAVKPIIVDHLYEEKTKNAALHWVKAHIRNKNYAVFANPALEKEWLTLQPEPKRAGLLLAGFRIRKGLSQHDVGRADDPPVSQKDLSLWELGTAKIKPMQLKRFAQLYDMTPAEVDQLTLLILPALNPEWLAKQPAIQQAGLFIKACRERLGLEQKDFESINVSRATMGFWEKLKPTNKIGLNKEDKLASALKVNELPNGKERLMAAIQTTNDAIGNERNAAVNGVISRSNTHVTRSGR